MKTISRDLIEETRELILSVKRHYIAISENVFKIYDAWTDSPDEWARFYESDLELHKSQVSKMLKVGQASIANGWRDEQVSYEKLYLSLNRHKDNPQLALSEAKTWPISDYKAQKKDDCTTPEYIKACKHCWATPEHHA